jgi:hypothetical protein
MHRIFSFLLALMLFFFCLVGCTIQRGLPVCEQIPEGETSAICEVAAAQGVSPESVSNIILFANLTGLVTEAYTAPEAAAVIDTVETYIVGVQKTGVTYQALIQAVLIYHGTLTPKMQAAFIVLQEFMVVPEVQGEKLLTEYDFKLILAALDKQRRVIAPFLL